MTNGEERLLKQVFKQPSDPLGFERLRPELQQQLIDHGLDPADRPISRGGEQALVTRFAERIFRNVGNLDELRSMLAAHGLNDELYDGEKNPHGILLAPGLGRRNKNLVIAFALYSLAGVSISRIGGFLGVKAMYAHRESYYSSAFKSRVAEMGSARKRFPLMHAKDFPVLLTSLEQICSRTGLEPGSLFEGDAIPPLVGHTKQLSLIQVLRAAALAVVGTFTPSEIAREVGATGGDTVSALLRNETQGIQFTPEALLVFKKIL